MLPANPPLNNQLELTPRGGVVCPNPTSELHPVFAESDAAGLIHLGGHPLPSGGDASVVYWKSFADLFIRELCHLPESQDNELKPLPPPDSATLSEWVLNAPPLQGAEYLSPERLQSLWERLEAWTRARAATLSGISEFLEHHAPSWTRVGRVTLHLAENKSDPEFPFAFMASYAAGLTRSGKLQQLPLGQALKESSGARNKAALLKLLTPLHRAEATSNLISDLVSTGDIFHPLAWTPTEAYAFLQEIPVLEEAGLLVRLPNWWQKRGKRPRVSAVIGEKKRSTVGLDALLDFRLDVVIDGTALSEEELAALLEGDDGLVLFRGQWIEVDREKLQQALDHWKAVEEAGGISFIEGMRLLAGAPSDLQDATELEEHREWAFAEPGAWLADTLRQLTSPQPMAVPCSLQATLRPYQACGLDWLWFCSRAGLGACLADDMGLGKTIQVLAALLRKKETAPKGSPSLLIVPASLIGNWKREATQFAPSLRLFIAHRSHASSEELTQPNDALLADIDLVVTTYGMLHRLDWPFRIQWGWVILDEAQAIKNAGSRQSKSVRKLQAQARIALTGTPIENNLGDLWSLFDFINPGLLGTSSQFKTFITQLRSQNREHYAPLRRLVGPYILRRLKTDRSIISDLPEKTEMKVFCGLTAAQAKLYQQSAKSLADELKLSDGIQRRGLVLAYLMRFKQICNHPDQLTKTGAYAPRYSAKFQRLETLCEEIASRGEKALIFTQFRELTEPLEACLSGVFGRGGLILHGGTSVKDRQKAVDHFQRDEGPPFFVLSLKAGGTGLNLTAASHVIHFDRWWNPAVENQATDRAFRIGQQRNVLVHKFITSGTLEEKIDALISEKQLTADQILSDGPEKNLTEMNNEELLAFIRLDLSQTDTST